jgi:dTDP-D-glucose 4,6-dehydratase|tara:strand:- start:2714 stop:3028 length:315 start_codon:yes stop_codon:yes gene_type:complete
MKSFSSFSNKFYTIPKSQTDKKHYPFCKENKQKVYEYVPTFPGLVSRRCPNISKAKKDISYNPKINWKIGVKDTVNWNTNYLPSNKPKESFYDKYSTKDSKKNK